jgi:hypothetical protein
MQFSYNNTDIFFYYCDPLLGQMEEPAAQFIVRTGNQPDASVNGSCLEGMVLLLTTFEVFL